MKFLIIFIKMSVYLMSLEIEKRFRLFDYDKIKNLFRVNNIKRKGGFLLKITS